MNEYKGSKVLNSFLPLVLDGGEWSTSCSSCSIPVKEPWDPLNRRLGGLQSQSEHSGEDKNFLPLPGLSFTDKNQN